MNLKILVPFQVFADITGVLSIVVESLDGSFGLLPHRLDCVAALRPGILIYKTSAEREKLVAVDEGVLVKTGGEVLVSVRRAIAGTELAQLRQAVEKEYLILTADEQAARTAMGKLEDNFLSRMATFHHD